MTASRERPRRPRGSCGGGRAQAAGRRPEQEAVYGVRPVLEALRAGRRTLHRVALRTDRGGASVTRIEQASAARGVPVERVSPEWLRQRAGAEALTQGVLLEAGPLPEVDLAALVEALPPGPAWLVLLDGVEDPQNAGAIARVAEAAGAAGLVLASRRAPPLGATMARASAGALEHLPIARVGNLRNALIRLKEQDFWVLGVDAREGTDLYRLADRALAGRLAWVLGAEGRGMRPGVLGLVDHRIRIPMRGRIESLNVATAAAVVLFEARRRGEKHTDD